MLFNVNIDGCDNDVRKLPYKYVWNDDMKNDYIDSLNCESVNQLFNDLSGNIESSQTSSDMDDNLISF